MYRAYLASLLLLGAVGCATPAPVAPAKPTLPLALQSEPPAASLCWSSDVLPGMDEWRLEAAKRFPGQPLMIFGCHGGPDATGMWYAWPDEPRKPVPVYYLARILKDLYPNRIIILICCNGSGTKIGVPGVAYATSKVWIASNVQWPSLLPRPPHTGTTTGSIYDFEYIP